MPVYVGRLPNGRDTPEKQRAGFARVSLEPAERQVVRRVLSVNDKYPLPQSPQDAGVIPWITLRYWPCSIETCGRERDPMPRMPGSSA
ncbi:hypothetical protein [Streptomyces sp. NPDC050564]|uniref:hypothetical protein n=1 Tax=Streptomyces sp. NPDC050564 TaxID=3365631 RepID=UPI003793C894